MSEDRWTLLHQRINACEACPLCRTALHRVPGQGDPASPLMLVGEGPGQREDEEGYAFIGAAGQLLTTLLLEIGLPRDRLYICNVVKCRPPGNRAPTPAEAAACNPWLRQQLSLVQPKVVVLLGLTAAQHLLEQDVHITRVRGSWYQKDGMWVMPTYHPSALLRDASKLPQARADFASLRNRLYALGLYSDLTAYTHLASF